MDILLDSGIIMKDYSIAANLAGLTIKSVLIEPCDTSSEYAVGVLVNRLMQLKPKGHNFTKIEFLATEPARYEPS